ncbi:hypothetical protein ZOSMA_486G00100 [Zostera marina]|uniref:DNA-directed primase/polymerase protein n=1 Tax=Zostera marina TaxID=29655 RepID=A0A0K9P1U4_ZOSMR|nr:hypothetical protein ZOSMA_486G00100 [Zostera marina]
MASSSGAKSEDVKFDVDRLYESFKCGITPPKSALLERKTRLRMAGMKDVSEHPCPSSLQRNLDQLNDTKPDTPTSIAIKFSRRNKISPMVFYGSPQGLPMKKPRDLMKLLSQIRVDQADQNDFRQRKDVWATFPRQDEAIKFAKTHKQVYVFCYQDHLNGQRRFLASTYDEFWRRYEGMTPNVRHHYEVIQEGFPCHLYYDLEFDKRANPIKDVDEMVDILLSITFNALRDKYSIDGDRGWVVELDSSTEVKFSRHLIICIQGNAFKDNLHVGAFVSEICSRILNQRESDPQIKKLYIKKESNTPDSAGQLFLDTAVYTRNRCFRLPFSSKAGKNSFLLPTKRFKCKNMDDREVFMESLICRIDAVKLLRCKLDPEFQRTLHFDSELNEIRELPNTGIFYDASQDSTVTYLTGKSPFPSLDVFVESMASSGTIPGKIRSWYWFSMYGLMVYSMLRNRYCERIAREHKSNHVMYVIDFQKAGYYQKCYDPDCRGYRSPIRPIPCDMIPDVATVFNSTQTQNYRQVMNINFDRNEEDENKSSCTDVECITDSCKKDSEWWQEAIKYADAVENPKNESELNHLLIPTNLETFWIDDEEWWAEVDKMTSQVELQMQEAR